MKTAYAASGHTEIVDSSLAVEDLFSQLGEIDPAAIFIFNSIKQDGSELAERFDSRWPKAEIVGCSTAGEISDKRSGLDGVSVLALERTVVGKCTAAIADFSSGIDQGVEEAIRSIEATTGPLRELDPKRWVGIVLIEGTHGSEERTNQLLGNVAPMLSFVGGSAGDSLAFEETLIYQPDKSTTRGAALILMEMKRPFHILKTCHFEPTEKKLVPNKVRGRLVQEFNGRPAAEAYAEAIGVSEKELGPAVFFPNPVGLMIDGSPWLRSPAPFGHEGSSIAFACEVPEGAQLYLMRRACPIIEDSHDALQKALETLGSQIQAGLFFSCAYRRLEMDAEGSHEDFVSLLDFPAAGFHTHGESWLGHINQTMTSLLIG